MSKLAKAGEMMDSGDPWENLANAIILQAADDYLASPEKRKREYVHLDEVIQFFYSDWFGVLTTANPNYILEKLDQEKRSKASRSPKLRNT